MIRQTQTIQHLIPLFKDDGSVVVHACRASVSLPVDEVLTVVSPDLASQLFVHTGASTVSRPGGVSVAGSDFDCFGSSEMIVSWDERSFSDIIRFYFREMYDMGSSYDLSEIETDPSVIAMPVLIPGEPMTIGFTAKIVHNEDYDPKCAVCAHHSQVIHDIVHEWLRNAILIDDWDNTGAFDIKNTRKVLCLKKSKAPVLARLLEWLESNFEDTLKLSAISAIVFTDYVSKQEFVCSMTTLPQWWNWHSHRA